MTGTAYVVIFTGRTPQGAGHSELAGGVQQPDEVGGAARLGGPMDRLGGHDRRPHRAVPVLPLGARVRPVYRRQAVK